MTTTLHDELDRWRSDLAEIAEISSTDGWHVHELRLAEAQHTIQSYRSRILPLLTDRRPCDAVLAGEMAALVDRLDDLRTDIYRTTVTAAYQEAAEILAALRSLARVAERCDALLDAAG